MQLRNSPDLHCATWALVETCHGSATTTVHWRVAVAAASSAVVVVNCEEVVAGTRTGKN